MTPRCSGELGQTAGFETIPFGILVFVSITLLIINAWGIVTNQGTADSIAREYLRAYTSAPNQAAAARAGRQVAALVAKDRGVPASGFTMIEPTTWGPCAVATVTVTIIEPEIRAPFVGGFGTTHITVTHRDRIDGYRTGVGQITDGACDEN